MAWKLFSTICLVILIVSASGQTPEKPTTETPVTTSATSTTTTSKATTTEAPPTTIPTTTSTTTPIPIPITTTIAPITTIAPPTPFPDPTKGNWSFFDASNNQTCIIVQFAIQLNLTYTTLDKKANNVLYNIPSTAKVVNGACGNTTDVIQLQWNQNNNLTIVFEKNDTVSRYDLASLKFQINVSAEFNATETNLELYLVQNNTFATPSHYSYYCNRKQLFNLTASEKSVEPVATLALTEVHLEAFHEPNNTLFSTAKDCDAIDTPDIIPIAVGCALAALVVVVLIAYLVGRRRAQTSGYIGM